MKVKEKIAPREHETTAVLQRQLMEQAPPDAESGRWINFRERYELAHQLVEMDAPVQIDFELNSGCNLKCPFCTHGHETIKNKVVDFESYKKVINEAKTMNICSIKLNYINEPLLNLELEKYIQYAKHNDIVNVYLSTNGIMLTKERSLKLINSGITKLFISIDAFSAETYLKMRKSKHYNKIIDNITNFLTIRDELDKRYPLVRVNFLKSKMNVHELDDFINYWNDRADMVAVQDMIELPDNQNKQQIIGMEKRKEFKCSFPFKMLVIDANKNILPCCTFHGRSMPLGNIDDMTLKEAWDSEQIKELRTIHKRGEYWKNKFCKICVNSGDV